MRYALWSLALTTGLWCTSTGAAAGDMPDACAILPPGVVKAIATAYPGARIVSERDYAKEELDEFRSDKQPCPGIAVGDANGDGLNDYGVLVATKTKRLLILAVMSASKGGWKVDVLSDLGTGEGIGGIYISTTPAGFYRDMFTEDHAPMDYPAEAGEVKKYRARHAGFVFGGIDSSGVAYFLAGKRWVHLWVSD